MKNQLIGKIGVSHDGAKMTTVTDDTFKQPRSAKLESEDQLLGAVLATWILVEDGHIKVERAADVCGVSRTAYLTIIKSRVLLSKELEYQHKKAAMDEFTREQIDEKCGCGHTIGWHRSNTCYGACGFPECNCLGLFFAKQEGVKQ